MKLNHGWAALALLAAACGQEPDPGGLTAEESAELNEAAAMLDEAANGGGEAAEAGTLPVTGEGAVNGQ